MDGEIDPKDLSQAMKKAVEVSSKIIEIQSKALKDKYKIETVSGDVE